MPFACRAAPALDRMKLPGLVALGVFAAIGALATALFIFSTLENPSSQFETYEDLVASGMVERGWVPVGMPKSARGIDETHDVSSNTGKASFTFEPADVQTTRESCKVLVETERGTTFFCPPFDGQAFILVLRRDGKGFWRLVDAV